MSSGGSNISGTPTAAVPHTTSAPVASRPLSQSHVWSPPKKVARGCSHVQDWIVKTPAWKEVYGTVLRYVNTQHLQRRWGKIVMERPTCCGCGEGSHRLLVSLHNVFVGCVDKGCFREHSKSTGNNLSVDLNRGELFCMACNDYVYDSIIDEVRSSVIDELQKTRSNEATANGVAGKLLEHEEPASKRSKVDTSGKGLQGCGGNSFSDVSRHCIPKRSEWMPTSQQVKQIQDHAQAPENSDVVGGLRGLHNVGNTCFLNCVLQGLVHNPGVRDYFLGDYHNRHRCQHRREADSKQDTVCMGCEMDRLVNDFFQPHKQAYTPHHFLYGMWKSSQHLAGYEQQDAHECLISVLTALQACCENDVYGKDGMIQTLFTGCMRSDVTCLECKAASITRDPFVDISLDLKSHPPVGHIAGFLDAGMMVGGETIGESVGRTADSALHRGTTCNTSSATTMHATKEEAHDATDGADKSLSACSNGEVHKIGSLAQGMLDGALNSASKDTRSDDVDSKGTASQKSSGSSLPSGSDAASEASPVSTVSLKQCLEWFTRVERLDAKGYKCDGCGSYQEGLKQLSIQTLPPSLCLQLKRFESLRNGGHNGGQQSFKVDTHVIFPAWLNMAPYLSAGQERAGNDKSLLKSSNGILAGGHADKDQAGHEETAGLEPIWYRLYAVVVHHGRLDSGHYTSFVRRGGDWFRCNDSEIVLVAEEEVLSSQAYLLLYTFASG